MNVTMKAGCVPPKAQRLLDATRQSSLSSSLLEEGLAACLPGRRLGDIGHAIQSYVEAHGFSIVREYCGHGIGRNFHEEPQLLHYGKAGTGRRLQNGMVFTIEPMVNEGTHETRVLDDGWTAVTADGKLSAQYEHTVAVTSDGAGCAVALCRSTVLSLLRSGISLFFKFISRGEQHGKAQKSPIQQRRRQR